MLGVKRDDRFRITVQESRLTPNIGLEEELLAVGFWLLANPSPPRWVVGKSWH